MDSPVKLELPAMTQTNVLQVLLPFLPGAVFVLGVSLSSSPMARRFWETDFVGYKTKIAVAIAIAYIFGLAMNLLTDSVTGSIIRAIHSVRPRYVRKDNYWKQVATAFIGEELVPHGETLSFQGTLNYLQHLARVNPSFHPQLEQFASDFKTKFETLQQTERDLETLKQSISKAPKEPEQAKATLQAKYESNTKSLEQIRAAFTDIRAEAEWTSLYHALELLPNKPTRFEIYALNISSLQASALTAIWTMAQYHEIWNLAAFVFALTVVALAVHGTWKLIELRYLEAQFQSPQIAAMLNEILKQRSDVKAKTIAF